MSNPYRADFATLNDPEKPIIYFDNAATTQKPEVVIETLRDYYQHSNANPLRGLYKLSIDSTRRYEAARHTVAQFLGAASDKEIIFTRNSTESLNLIAYTYGLDNIREGDEIVITVMEHHSNMLPWQMVAKRKHAILKYIYPMKDGTITKEEYESKITEKTKILAVGHISNVLGVENPVKELIAYAHSKGAIVVVDGAQGAAHVAVNVQEMDADFYVFSGHKIMSPMGIGVLYGKQQLLEEMPPFLRGGEMIDPVTEQDCVYAPLPEKFEAGTPNVGGAVALEAAIHYLQKVGYDEIGSREESLTRQLLEGMKQIPEVEVYGPVEASRHHGVVSFNIKDVHPHDVSSILDTENIAIRAGHHCAQPLMKFLGIDSCCRASLSFYNTKEEVEHFLSALKNIRGWLGYGS